MELQIYKISFKHKTDIKFCFKINFFFNLILFYLKFVYNIYSIITLEIHKRITKFVLYLVQYILELYNLKCFERDLREWDLHY